MITDPRVFEGRYLPNSLPYRDAELSQLARSLEPVCRGEPANDVLISGPSGVGKTVLARYALDKIEELEAMPHTYVRCLGSTGGDILRAVLRDHPDVDPSQIHTNTAIDELRDQLLAADSPFVAILDEADDLPETDALELLTGQAALSLIVICHDADGWRSRLDVDHARALEGDSHIALSKCRASDDSDSTIENGSMVRSTSGGDTAPGERGGRSCRRSWSTLPAGTSRSTT